MTGHPVWNKWPLSLQRWTFLACRREASGSLLTITNLCQGMEHLWSRADATAGNPRRIREPPERVNHAETAACDCD